MPKRTHFAGLLILVIGLFTGVVLVQKEQNIFTRAWSGIVVNVENLARQVGLSSKAPISESSGAQKTKQLFDRLTKTYFDAEVQNISEPAFNILGVAFLKYDAIVDKTFVYSRVQNLPPPAKGFIRLWLNDNVTEYVPVGIAEFLPENGINVTYSVFVRDGDLRTHEKLLFSYDSSLEITSPESVVLSLNF